ncbi:substrate-binding domain-containing protein [Spirulina sp. CS-785/01]|uniref:substrate-binding domain-containing protein n=1 Tax=Spirulina sp. CS-785/01 TaxID=3021716 RepID=UPI00232E4A91|nr:substrate-binding domain-containing protein [Spirulina sp. CS-785/01]MDB9312662.1 substrate-binding domain-containing protein [Spirulina sp. CS-785/01]
MAKKGIVEQIRERQSSGFGDRVNLFIAESSYRVASIVPVRYRWIVPQLIERVSLPLPEFSDVKGEIIANLTGEELEEETAETAKVIPIKPLYPAYRCLRNNPLHCEWPEKTLAENPDSPICLQCSFPALLKPESRILGIRGTYQVESFFRSRHLGRLYRGIDLSDRTPVMIKEYLLPKRYFNRDETRIRQTNFINLTGFDLADGRKQDERLITVQDAIAPRGEQRCYLVTKGNTDSFPTLARYLEETGPLTPPQVRQVLLQVLQTLEFLHGQKYRFPNGIIREGLTHGNLTLESLLIGPTLQGFYIYLCDAALWENLFYPPAAELPLLSVQKDLEDLGRVAFYLLVGRSLDPETNQPLNPTFEEHWPPVHKALKDYILSLVGFSPVRFENAGIARQALLNLPPLETAIIVEKPEEEEPEVQKKRRNQRWWLILFGVLGVSLLALLIWYLIRRAYQMQAIEQPPICCINQVLGEIPPETYTFTGERAGIWTHIWTQRNLIAKDQSFAEIVDQEMNPDAVTNIEETADAAASDSEGEMPPPETYNFNYRPAPSATEAIARIRNFEAEFAVSSLFKGLGVDLWYERFAYDAIAVYVSFSYAERQNSLPQYLNGEISLTDVRRLYTGEISNWQELGGPDLAVKLYAPDDQEALELFKQRVLQTPEAIEKFEALLREPTGIISVNPNITQLSTFGTLNAVIRDFEDEQIGAIAFGSLSQVFGQCSVYPLALKEGLGNAIFPLLQQENQPITPDTDLCNKKGSYFPNVEAIRSHKYPLSYTLAVVYPRDNRRQPAGLTFIELLKTTQGQKLLSEAGLIPIRDISEEDMTFEE